MKKDDLIDIFQYRERTKRIKKLIPDWRVGNQMFDLRLCPDCETLQLKKSMVDGSKCDNPECQSEVHYYTGHSEKYNGMLMWTNENWD